MDLIHPLQSFLEAKQGAFSVTPVATDEPFKRFVLRSQEWQGNEWIHPLWWLGSSSASGDVALLYLTGDEVVESDWPYVRAIAAASGLPTFALFAVPNQPLWDLREDDLIAHTFVEAIEREDWSWPLLFPMVRSVIAAIDAIQLIAPGIQRVIVTGMSKRGWTSWLVAASGDPRIIGIAPQVYDHLNIEAQIKDQIQKWGQLSPMLDDYSRRALEAVLEHEQGRKLARMVDPYSYRERLDLPKLIIAGVQDPFWAVDALQRYWWDLPGAKWSLCVPNAGHDAGFEPIAIRALGAFCRMLAGQGTMPVIHCEIGTAVIAHCQRARRIRLWESESSTMWFADAVWSVAHESAGETLECPITETQLNLALLVEATFETELGDTSLTSPVFLVPPRNR